MDLLSHPFRLERSGAVATVEDDTDQAYAEGIAVLALTRRGERQLVPAFGIADPTLDHLAAADLNVGLTDYGPPVRIVDLTAVPTSDVTQAVTLTFTPTEE